jgi:threonine dehydrogenase-like Zn-dependent dehydrogenase
MMRAGQMHGVNEMRCIEMPVPGIDDGQIMVKTSLASICGSDLHVVCHGAGIPYPFPCPHGYPGHEGVGEVVESRSPLVEPGTRVLCFPQAVIGEGFSEYQRMAGKYVWPLPDTSVSEPELLMAQQLGTVIFAARQRSVDVVGRTVLILGQGSAGLFWSYWLKRNGAARVIAVDLSEARLAASPGFGADIVINAAETDVHEAIRELTGDGADYVVEAVGRRETLYQSIELVRPQGDLMWFGLPDTDDSVPISFSKFFRKRLTATSTYGAQDEGDAVSFRTALDLIANRQIDVTPLLSHMYPIEEINTAFAVANDPIPSGALKVSVSF